MPDYENCLRPIVGLIITRIIIDPGALQLNLGTQLEITLASQTTYTSSTQIYTVDCGLAGKNSPLLLCPFLNAMGNVVSDAVIDKDSRLRMAFADGTSLSASPSEKYESWEIGWKDGSMLVCTPGGHISHYGPRAQYSKHDDQ